MSNNHVLTALYDQLDSLEERRQDLLDTMLSPDYCNDYEEANDIIDIDADIEEIKNEIAYMMLEKQKPLHCKCGDYRCAACLKIK